ncbi:uncharacterized protein LOC124162585 [Ischnura elegans]|uniref:uncharacterized protein LOC124162585 n=1 Tax=Ischnura elegans TaxID=197161 RepID=UPI001ED86A4D|nr:uncharacterized protein LOC124162585 [Ischnura elegans]
MKKIGNSLSRAPWHIFLLFLTNFLESDGALNDTKRLAEWVEPYKFVKLDGCNKDFMKDFGKVVEGSACKPRPVLIDIMSPSSEIQFLPNKVVVNRCDGICHTKLKCIPTSTVNISVKVQQINYLESNIQRDCGEVQVEEHTKCNCQCPVTKEHCNKNQVYQPGECSCLCTNEDEKTKCFYEEKTWDNDRCSCV